MNRSKVNQDCLFSGGADRYCLYHRLQYVRKFNWNDKKRTIKKNVIIFLVFEEDHGEEQGEVQGDSEDIGQDDEGNCQKSWATKVEYLEFNTDLECRRAEKQWLCLLLSNNNGSVLCKNFP